MDRLHDRDVEGSDSRVWSGRNKLADLEKWLSGDTNVADVSALREEERRRIQQRLDAVSPPNRSVSPNVYVVPHAT